MNLLACLIIHTSNVLGIFNDPFEFEGDYGPEVNPVRAKVFELVVSKEALSTQLTDADIKHAIEQDRNHGPRLSEIITSNLMEALAEKQKKLQNAGFNEADLKNIRTFLDRYANQKMFYFLRNNPREFLSLDKILRDKAARGRKAFDLPILSSTQPLHGTTSEELKKELLDKLFTEEMLRLTKSEDLLRNVIDTLDPQYLEKFFGKGFHNQDLQVFCTPAGQLFFYWLYQSLNLHLISEDAGMIEQVNRVKDLFVQTLGNSRVRAEIMKGKFLKADSAVVFTQESDTFLAEALVEKGLFLPVSKQNPQDGTFVFLRSDRWGDDCQVISIDEYDGFAKGRINALLAKNKQTGKKFLLASAHGNSTDSADGRLQIALIVKKWKSLSLQPENVGLQLLIGIDANTKSAKDVQDLKRHLEELGLVSTSVGPTTVKRRMVTVQHAKAGRLAIDEEDYLITLKPENGCVFSFAHPTVGFSEEKPDSTQSLPNINNPSDHYPVGVTLK